MAAATVVDMAVATVGEVTVVVGEMTRWEVSVAACVLSTGAATN